MSNNNSADPYILPARYVTKDELEACLGEFASKLDLKLVESKSETERTMTTANQAIDGKLSSLPTKENMFFGWISTAALIFALLAILQMWFSSGYDASENKDGLQDSIDKNEATIQRILNLQEQAEVRAKRDSKNLQILVDGHTHRLDFDEESDEKSK